MILSQTISGPVPSHPIIAKEAGPFSWLFCQVALSDVTAPDQQLVSLASILYALQGLTDISTIPILIDNAQARTDRGLGRPIDSDHSVIATPQTQA